MTELRRLDDVVRHRLQQWPQRPPGLDRHPGPAAPRTQGPRWLRGRPTYDTSCHPFLKLPGSNRLRTLPDGLWLNFAGSPDEPFVDIFAVEACGSLQNLLDKRSRFAPSTHSLLAVCPVPWLLANVTPSDATPRWKATGVLRAAPERPLVLPVRDIRVLYALKKRQYQGFAESQLPHPHEYFMPMETLIAENGHENPALRQLVARASARSNFFSEA